MESGVVLRSIAPVTVKFVVIGLPSRQVPTENVSDIVKLVPTRVPVLEPVNVTVVPATINGAKEGILTVTGSTVHEPGNIGDI
jgi:hypothetical protein